jgi:hypothetical protein
VIRAWLRSIADAILGRVPGKVGRVDTATRMAMDADFRGAGKWRTSPPEPKRKMSPREPQSEVSPIAELERILKEGE